MVHFATFCDDKVHQKDYSNLIELKKDLQEAINNNTLDTFEENYPKHFNNSLEK